MSKFHIAPLELEFIFSLQPHYPVTVHRRAFLDKNLWYHYNFRGVRIAEKRCVELLKFVNSRGIYAHTYSETEIISVSRDDPQLKRYLEITGERLLCLNSWDELRDDIIPKVICINYSDASGLHALYDEYRASGDGRYECFFSSPMYLEFTRLEVDKGLGVRRPCDMLDIPPSDCFAIRDEENDIPMIREQALERIYYICHS